MQSQHSCCVVLGCGRRVFWTSSEQSGSALESMCDFGHMQNSSFEDHQQSALYMKCGTQSPCTMLSINKVMTFEAIVVFMQASISGA